MRLRHLVAGAFALALFFAPFAAFAEEAACEFTVDAATQELDASGLPYVVLDGDLKEQFTLALAEAIRIETGNPAPDMSIVTRVMLVEIKGEMFFGIETPDGCLSAPVPLAVFFPDVPRSGRDALGTHS